MCSRTSWTRRLIGLAIHSYDHEDIGTIKDLNQTLEQGGGILHIPQSAKGKNFKVTGTGGPIHAMKFLKRRIKAHKAKAKKEGWLWIRIVA